MYLMHHGIKGMRWGIRRYQNEDGSLTAKGRKRYMKKYVTDYDDEGNEIYAYTLSKRGRKAYAKFEKKNKGNYFDGVESRNYRDPRLLAMNKKGKAPSTIEMLSSLLERQGQLFQDGRMFTNEYLSMNEAVKYATIAYNFDKAKNEAAWRYKTDRPTLGEQRKWTEQDFGRKKFRNEK